MSPERVRAFREDYRQEKLPKRYEGWRHLTVTTSLCLGAIVGALARIESLELVELIAVPVTWIVANLVEYAVHRGPMHRLSPLTGKLYKRHTGEHHRFFSPEVMAVDSAKDFHVTLFPARIALFFVALLGLPLALLVSLVLGPDLGLLTYAALVGYYLAYEWLHLGSHMPEDSFIGRLPGVAAVRRHHRLHHDTSKMRRLNFNFGIPLGDWLFGTRER